VKRETVDRPGESNDSREVDEKKRFKQTENDKGKKIKRRLECLRLGGENGKSGLLDEGDAEDLEIGREKKKKIVQRPD